MAEVSQMGMDPASPPDPDAERQVEYRVVKALQEEYDTARKFDEDARKQYAIDRRYAGGVKEAWAVSVNLIGSFIDVLCSYLYARNPDVSCARAEQVPPPPPPQDPMMQLAHLMQQQEAVQENIDMEAFAKTLQLVISRLWLRGRLKHAIKKGVRSSLSCGPGWLKAIMVTDKRTDPQVQAALNDARDNLARIERLERELSEGEAQDIELTQRQLMMTIQGLEAKVEVIVRRGLAIDFCAAEDVQCSLDVRDLDDYRESGWMANAIYRPISMLAEMFPRIETEKLKKATNYYQRAPMDPQAAHEKGELSAGDAESFTKQGPQMVRSPTGADPIPFAKIIEVWDRRDNLIKTMVEGIDCWAKEPYPPPNPSTRFYPYFLIALYMVDGARHPQSLAWRLHQLQDEYSATRSSARTNRNRSVPAILFNAEQIDKANAEKLEKGVDQEWIGLKLTNPSMPMRDVFAEKPYARMDPILFDTSTVEADMEKVSGVQEALQSSVVQPKTATEAEIQQSGFASRTSADRDTLEDMLNDLAHYTAEVSIGALPLDEVKRIAGRYAWWPAGMDIEDLLTMVEVDITAGSTGKPNTSADREAWTVALPLIQGLMLQIQQQRALGNEPMAQAMIHLLRETLQRLGDRIEVERFIPGPLLPMQTVPGMPGMPGAPGAPPPPGAPDEPVPPSGGESFPGDVAPPPPVAPPPLQPTAPMV